LQKYFKWLINPPRLAVSDKLPFFTIKIKFMTLYTLQIAQELLEQIQSIEYDLNFNQESLSDDERETLQKQLDELNYQFYQL